MSTDRLCVIHVGTHKTGTTAIQYFLAANADVLKNAGILFSKTGWYGVVAGNHAIAWDILSGVFDASIAELERELQAWHGHAILSAEDFSLQPTDVGAIPHFIDRIRSCGYIPHVILYLRAQPAFAESMYAERIKQGDIGSLDSYLAQVLANGTYRLKSAAVNYRYSDIITRWTDVAGPEHVDVRVYRGAREQLAIFHDILSAVQHAIPTFDFRSMEFDVHHPKINESLNFGALLANAYIHATGAESPGDASAFRERWVPEVPVDWFNERFALLLPQDHLSLLNAFGADNATIARRWGADLRFAAQSDLPQAGQPVFARAAVERAAFNRALAIWQSGR